MSRGGLGVHCEGVVQIYPVPDGDVVALRGVDLDVGAGETVALMGPSGSGKSTVLALLAGLLRPSAGRVQVGEWDLGRLARRELARLRAAQIGLVLQDPARNLLPYATAEQNVRFAQRGRDTWIEPRRVLERLGLLAVAGRVAAELSGGEQQRLAVAVGVAMEPGLLLVDEPTSQLDAESRDRVLDLVHELGRELRATVILVSHDPAVAAAVPRTVTIRDGRVGSEGRRGEEYAVVARDGTLQLPPDLLEVFPPGTLVRLRRHPEGVDIRREAEA